MPKQLTNKVVEITTDSRYKHPKVRYPFPQHESSTLIVAPKGSGKTNLIGNMLLNFLKGYFHKIIVCSGTVLGDDKWDVIKGTKGVLADNKKKQELLGELPPKGDKKVPKVVFKDAGHSEEVKEKVVFDGKMRKEHFVSALLDIEPFLAQQKRELRSIRKKLIAKGKDVKEAKMISDRMMIIIDDMAGQFPQGVNSPITKYVISHRHYNSSCIIVTQANRAIPKSIRVNMNAIIIFEIPNFKELLTLYEEWPENMTFEEWMRVYQEATRADYSFLYLNNHFPRGKRAFINFEEQLVYKGSKEERDGPTNPHAPTNQKQNPKDPSEKPPTGQSKK